MPRLATAGSPALPVCGKQRGGGMAAGGTILVASNGGLTTLTLNRPDKLNSFNEAMHAELRTALEHCAADPGCRAILLTGAGRAFCAGQDLSDRAMSADEGPPDLGDTLDRLYNPLIQLVRTLEKPSSVPSTVLPRVRGPTWRSPATSSWQHARPASSRRSAGWVSSPTRAAPGFCRASSARLAPEAWRSWASASPPRRPKPGA